MAQTAIGRTPATLYLQCNQRNGDKIYNCAVKDEIVLTREPNVATKLTATILRDELTPEVGDFVKLVVDENIEAKTGHYMFYGFIFETSKEDEWCDIVAYDQLIYLARSKTRKVFENITLRGMLLQICEETRMSTTEFPVMNESEYIFPYIIEDNTSYLNIMTNAMDKVYEITKEKFYIWDDCGSLAMTTQAYLAGDVSTIIQPSHCEGYRISESLSEDFYTRVRVEKVTKQKTDGTAEERETTTFQYDDLYSKYGHLEYYQSVNKDDPASEIAKSYLDTHCAVARTLSITGAQGDVSVRGGTPVLVDFFTFARKEYLRGWYETKSVTHHFKHQHHTMDLELKLIKPYHTWSQDTAENCYIGQSDLLGYW